MERTGVVIFDLDGTLFRADRATVGAVYQACREFGIRQPNEAEILEFIGRPSTHFYEWLGSICEPTVRDTFAGLVDSLEIRFVIEEGQLYPKIESVLRELHSSTLKLALCTNGRRKYVETVLNTFQLSEFFAAVRYRRNEQDDKPKMLRELLTHLKDRPAIMVGDREMDIDAAHQNGILAIGVTYGYGSKLELAAADFHASAPAELPILLDDLLNDIRSF